MQGGVEVLSENFRKFAPKYVIMDRFNWEDIKQKFKSDKRFKLYTYIGGGAIVLVALFLGYRQLIWTPADEKANDVVLFTNGGELGVDKLDVYVVKSIWDTEK